MLDTFKEALFEICENGIRAMLSSLLYRKDVYIYIPVTDEQALVQDNILQELEASIKMIEREKFELFKAASRKATKVDYTWLINVPSYHYKIPTMDRMEVEALAYKIRPEDTLKCVKCFRSLVTPDTGLGEVTLILLSVLRKQVSQYQFDKVPPNTDSAVSAWSVIRKIRSDSKVYPVMRDLEGDLQLNNVNVSSIDFNAKDVVSAASSEVWEEGLEKV